MNDAISSAVTSLNVCKGTGSSKNIAGALAGRCFRRNEDAVSSSRGAMALSDVKLRIAPFIFASVSFQVATPLMSRADSLLSAYPTNAS